MRIATMMIHYHHHQQQLRAPVALTKFLLLVLLLLLQCCSSYASTALSKKKIALPGASGSGPVTVATEWAVAFGAQYPEASITLNGIGSGSTQKALWGDIDCIKRYVPFICDDDNGILQEGGATVWGLGDAPFSFDVYDDHPELQLQHLPAMAAAVVPICSATPELNLTLEVIADIFTSKILYWDDPKLLTINPTAKLPHETIRVVVRTDSSGQNYIFTDALGRSKSADWPTQAIGKSPDWQLDNTVEFNTGIWLNNSNVETAHHNNNYEVELGDGIISAVLRVPWSIGYVSSEFYEGIADFVSQVKVGAAATTPTDGEGVIDEETTKFVTAGNESITITMSNPDNTVDPNTLDITLADTVPKGGYPIVGFGYWYFKKSHTAYENCYQAWLVAKFIEWSYTDEQAARIALKYGWVVPPTSVVKDSMAKLSEIMCLDPDSDDPFTPMSVTDYVPPSYENDMNYISDPLLAIGYSLVALVGVLSLICALFLYFKRKEWHVKVSQPEVLGVVIIGCFVSSLSIIFMGYQAGYRDDDEDLTNKVDAGCMAVPWLYGIGFVLTFSMLFAKIVRVKLIVAEASKDIGESKRRIRFADTWKVIAFMLIAELGILISWQVISPLMWERETLQEENGLVVESVGECTSDYGYFFFAALVGFHVICLFYALILTIQTSHIDSRFAESKYISLSVAFMFQVMVMAVPIAALVRDNTSVYYLVRVLAVFLQNFTVLALLFVPKLVAVLKDGNNQRLVTAVRKSKKVAIKLSALTDSKWDAGVDTINELLEEDGEVYTVMTDDQRAELENVKVLLLERNDSKNDPRAQIPMQLLKRASNKKGDSEGLDHETAAYIMREYGGVTDESSRSSRSFTADETFEEEPVLPFDDANSYLLPEFKELSTPNQKKVCELLSWKSINAWGFNVFDLAEFVGKRPLLFMGWAVMGSPHAQRAMAKECGLPEPSDEEGYNFMESELQIPMRKLCNYLRVINDDYQDNPYHNAIHASDVLQTLHSLIQMDSMVKPNTVELFSILLAAAVHDVGHPGLNNAFQSKARTDLSLIYNDKSVLENKHASHAFLTMMSEDGAKLRKRTKSSESINLGYESNLNIVCNVSDKQLVAIRSKVVDAILYTDMSTHFGMVNATKSMLLGNGPEALDDDDRWKILVYMMHMADISGQAKPEFLSLLWTDRVMEEFFAQGDREAELGLPISNLCDRKTTNMNDAQIGFIEFVIKPAYEVLGGIIPEVERNIIPIIDSNYNHFVKEKASHRKEQTIP